MPPNWPRPPGATVADGFAHARRILVCLRYGIGDLVMQLPALEALRAAAPQAHIGVIGAEPAVTLLDGDPRVDEVAAIQQFGLSHWGDAGSAAQRAPIRAWLDERGFDLILDPSHAAVGLGRVVWASGGELRDADSALERQALARTGGGPAALREAVRLGWGLTVDPLRPPRLHFDPDEQEAADCLWRACGLDGQAVVALAPVASAPLKRWPLPHWVQVAEALAAAGLRSLFLPGPDGLDGAAFDHLSGALVAPPLPLKGAAGLIARCRALLGNDTGLTHIAGAVGTPVVAVFGPTSPAIYLPPGGWAALPGTPCPHRPADRFGPPECVRQGRCLVARRGCIEAIDPAQVARLVLARLG